MRSRKYGMNDGDKVEKSSLKWYAAVTTMLGRVIYILGYGYIILLFLCFVPCVLGYQEYVVVSGSMEPAVPVGSCVLVRKVKETEVLAGDIITYCLPNSETVITHRVIRHNTLTNSFDTKGDANDKEDAVSVPYSQVLGRVQLCIPLLGYFLAMQNIPGIKTCGIALVLVLAFSGRRKPCGLCSDIKYHTQYAGESNKENELRNSNISKEMK